MVVRLRASRLKCESCFELRVQFDGSLALAFESRDPNGEQFCVCHIPKKHIQTR